MNCAPQEMLRFEQTRGLWFRYGYPALVVVYLIAVAALIAFDQHWWLSLAAIGVVLSYASARLGGLTRTLVSRDQITVQRNFRRRAVPTLQIVEVVRHTAWNPVAMRLTSGETVVLPRVEVSDLASIVRLLGEAGETSVSQR